MKLMARAPAKINLHLQVIGRRPDGFHEVRTLLQSIDLVDELAVEDAPVGHVSVDVNPPDSAPADESNLMVRAARRLWRDLEREPGVRMTVTKRIPASSGMGGGSADAAVALVLLDRLWGLNYRTRRLEALAADLGSDVPFFLRGGLALGIGRGDEVHRLPDLGPMGVVVALPDRPIPTAVVYGMLPERLTWCRPEANVCSFAAGAEDRSCWETMYNDLQIPVLEAWPTVGNALRDIGETGPFHMGVSGSGGAVFGLYPDLAAADRAGGVVRTRWRTHVGVVLGREEARPTVRNLGG